MQTELTVLDQLDQQRAALLDKCSASESQLHDFKVHNYTSICMFMGVTCIYSGVTIIFCHAGLKKQTKLHEEEVEELKGMQEEMTALCQLYKDDLDKTKKLLAKEQHHGAKLASENKSLEAQLGFASQFCHAGLKKQTKLHEEEVEELKGMQEEMTALCQLYKDNLDKTKKLLAKEQHHGAKLASENKSLEAQLGFASQKLSDLEKRKNSRAASPPPLGRKRKISSRKRAERYSPPPFDPLTTSPLPTRRRTSEDQLTPANLC